MIGKHYITCNLITRLTTFPSLETFAKHSVGTEKFASISPVLAYLGLLLVDIIP